MKGIKSIFLLMVLLLTALACNFSQNVSLPEITVPAEVNEEASTAVTRAASVAATAAAGEAGEAAATAVAQGGDIVATAEASDFQLPEVSAGALQEQFANLQPDENGNITVTITEGQLNQAIAAQQQAAAEAGTQTPVQNLAVALTGGNIVMRGDISDPITAQLSVSFRASVVDGVPQFEVVEASVGAISVPPSLLESAESTLNDTLGQAITNLPNNVVLQEIIVEEGILTIRAQNS